MKTINKEHFEDFNEFLVENGFNPCSLVKSIEELRLIQTFLFEIDGQIIAKSKSDLIKEYYSKARVIKDSCEYCTPDKNGIFKKCYSGYKSEHTQLSKDGEDFVIDVSIHSFDVENDTKHVESCFDINHCHVCGRKL